MQCAAAAFDCISSKVAVTDNVRIGLDERMTNDKAGQATTVRISRRQAETNGSHKALAAFCREANAKSPCCGAQECRQALLIRLRLLLNRTQHYHRDR